MVDLSVLRKKPAATAGDFEHLSIDPHLQSRKAIPGVEMPEGIGTREHYREGIDTMKRDLNEIMRRIPVQERLQGSALPRSVAQETLARQAIDHTEGALDPLARGKCGELGYKCPLLYSMGVRACNGFKLAVKGAVVSGRPPCPYRNDFMPITKGKFIVDGLRK